MAKKEEMERLGATVRGMLDDGVATSDMLAIVIAEAGALIAAVSRSKEQCDDLACSMGSILRKEAAIAYDIWFQRNRPN